MMSPKRLLLRVLDTPLSSLLRGQIAPRGEYRDVLKDSGLDGQLTNALEQRIRRACWGRNQRIRLAESLVEVCHERRSADPAAPLVQALQQSTDKPRGVSPAIYLKRQLLGKLPGDLNRLLDEITNPIQSRKLHAAVQSALTDRWSIALREGVSEPELWEQFANPQLLGKFVNQLQSERALRISELPADLRRFVERVVKRTGLWPTEKQDVAEELVDHFACGIETHLTSESLVSSFGDPAVAARLIRRAKVRCRPWYWHVWRRTAQFSLGAIGVLTVAWFAMSSRMAATPTVGFDLIGEFDKRSRSLPVEERAWPKYREGLLARIETEGWRDLDLTSPKSTDAKTRADGLKYLEANRDSLELFLTASKRQKLGFTFNDPENMAWLEKDSWVSPGSTDFQIHDPEVPVMYTLLPHVPEFRATIFSLMHWALIEAEEQGDADRVAELLHSMIRLSAHSAESSEFQVSKAMARFALMDAGDVLMRLLDEDKVVLSNEDLRKLCTSIEVSFEQSGSVWAADFESTGKDTLQRVYTDDGSGDGYVTNVGMELMCQDDQWALSGQNRQAHPLRWLVFSGKSPSNLSDRFRFHVLSKAAAAIIGSRSQMQSAMDEFVEAARVDRATPYWQTSKSQFGVTHERFSSTAISRAKYAPLLTFTGYTDRVDADRLRNAAETNRKNAWLVAIATELYRRQQGAWPESLDELKKRQLLTVVPLDQFDGKPLRYRLDEAGKPLLYSVGPDQLDDDAEPLFSDFESPNPYSGAPFEFTPPAGDWQLLPVKPSSE